MLDSIHKEQQEIFSKFQGEYRSLLDKMEKELERIDAEKNWLSISLKEAEKVKNEALSLEKKAQSKMSEANLMLEKAIAEQFKAIEEQGKLERLILQHGTTDKALGAQREELMAREQAVINAEKIVEMKQRKLKFERMKIDKIIEDKNIQKELESFKDE